ncbi:MAG: hypothetical protein LH613_05220, partial [Chamaesiphon sp.]|nr:hypothetical protein [Chamaesiphon sp.]
TKEDEDNQRKFAHIPWQSQKIYVWYDPQYTECIETELIPRDRVILLLKEILDTNSFPKYISTYQLPIKESLISPDELPF